MPEPTVSVPEHVANFAWATGYEVEHLTIGAKGWGYTAPSAAWVPELESPEWRQAVMDGLLLKGTDLFFDYFDFGYSATLQRGKDNPMDPESLNEILGYAEATVLNLALNAACTKAREAT